MSPTVMLVITLCCWVNSVDSIMVTVLRCRRHHVGDKINMPFTFLNRGMKKIGHKPSQIVQSYKKPSPTSVTRWCNLFLNSNELEIFKTKLKVIHKSVPFKNMVKLYYFIKLINFVRKTRLFINMMVTLKIHWLRPFSEK